MPAFTFKTHLFTPFLVSCLLVSAPLMAESESGLDLTVAQQSSLGLVTQSAVELSVYPSANYPAEAMIPLNTIRTLSSPLAGMMRAVNVVHGPIEKGQVLAEIESAELLELQAKLLATIANLTVANSDLKRAKQLGKSGVSSAKNLQKAQALVTQLKAARAQQKQGLLMTGMSTGAVNTLLTSQTLQSANLKIISPIKGQLYDLQVRLGERVTANQPLFSLGETDPIVLVVRVPVSLSNQLKEGQSAFIPSLKKQGVIEHVDSEVDTMTQSVDIHVLVDNSDHTIRPGQLFELHFLMPLQKSDQNRVLYKVPLSAISKFEGEVVVFIAEDPHIKALPIEVKNITHNTLYFLTKTEVTQAPSVFVKGSTAIKSAFEAAESDEDEG